MYLDGGGAFVPCFNVSTVDCPSYAMDSTKLDLSHAIRRMYIINLGMHCDAIKWILLIYEDDRR